MSTDEPVGPSSHELSDSPQQAFDHGRAYRELLASLDHSEPMSRSSYAVANLAPSLRATAPTPAPSLETAVLDRIATASVPVTMATVYRSLPPRFRAKRHAVSQIVDDLIASGRVNRTLDRTGAYIHSTPRKESA